MVAFLEGANWHTNKMKASCAGYMSVNTLPLNALVYTYMARLPHLHHMIELPYDIHTDRYERETETRNFVGT